MHKILFTIVVFLSSGWCLANDTVDEIVVEAPNTAIETEVRDYGVVRARYRASAHISTKSTRETVSRTTARAPSCCRFSTGG